MPHKVGIGIEFGFQYFLIFLVYASQSSFILLVPHRVDRPQEKEKKRAALVAKAEAGNCKKRKGICSAERTKSTPHEL